MKRDLEKHPQVLTAALRNFRTTSLDGGTLERVNTSTLPRTKVCLCWGEGTGKLGFPW